MGDETVSLTRRVESAGIGGHMSELACLTGHVIRGASLELSKREKSLAEDWPCDGRFRCNLDLQV